MLFESFPKWKPAALPTRGHLPEYLNVRKYAICMESYNAAVQIQISISNSSHLQYSKLCIIRLPPKPNPFPLDFARRSDMSGIVFFAAASSLHLAF